MPLEVLKFSYPMLASYIWLIETLLVFPTNYTGYKCLRSTRCVLKRSVTKASYEKFLCCASTLLLVLISFYVSLVYGNNESENNTNENTKLYARVNRITAYTAPPYSSTQFCPNAIFLPLFAGA